MVYAPHSGKPDEEKERFWNEVFHLVSCTPQNEMVVFAGDMTGHIGSSNVGYDGTHGGFGYGSRISAIGAVAGHFGTSAKTSGPKERSGS